MIISCFPLGYGGQGGGDTPTPSGPFSFTGEYLYIDDGDGDWRVKFLSSGTLTPNENLTVDIFAVGGGSGGRSGKYTYGPVYYNGVEVGYTYEHHSGGGGAGGYTATVTDKVLQAGHTYQVVVGQGGKVNQDGGESSLGSLIRAGGGKMNATDQSYFNNHGRWRRRRRGRNLLDHPGLHRAQGDGRQWRRRFRRRQRKRHADRRYQRLA